jgi:hypothetical protein
MTTETKTDKDMATVIFDKISELKGKDTYIFYSSLGLLLIATLINIFPLIAVILSISIGIFGIFSVMKNDLKAVNISIAKTIEKEETKEISQEKEVSQEKIIEKTAATEV